MKATGIVRRIDDLGRIVIPKEIRRTLRIREGDPLEIFTEKDGSVVFKKYSPVGEWSEPAGILCESIFKATGFSVAVTDRDTFVAVCGAPKRDLSERRLSSELESLMDGRGNYLRGEGDPAIPLTDNDTKHVAESVSPIISEGDVLGSVVFFSQGDKLAGETESKLAQAAALFLGRRLE
ncbi:MAG: AbrB/MazE/SpoVT family DNA-binding domain-containing protein [Oscillospiraceae bacterium]|jgi:AbrB family transcriptional regulator (stage V sporulation protein T)|nr:AbrB/MazE/SpoVT family DNA-binding domain-containing protein [Oscillospiraceae bacterium]